VELKDENSPSKQFSHLKGLVEDSFFLKIIIFWQWEKQFSNISLGTKGSL